MIPDASEPARLFAPPIRVEQPPAVQAAPAAPSPPALSQEEIQAIQKIFSHKQAAPEPGAGLLGLWAAGMLAHDLAQEASSSDDDEDEEQAAGPAD
jgi:hypothetical protein